MKWINATGLILQFLAFWFAAPELLGSATIGRLEKGLTRLIGKLPVALMFILIGLYIAVYVVGGTLKGIRAGKEGMEEGEMVRFYIEMGLASICYFLLIAFYKKLNNWLHTKMAAPLIEKLIHQNETRRIALAIGALLFTVGFLMQLVVVIVS